MKIYKFILTIQQKLPRPKLASKWKKNFFKRAFAIQTEIFFQKND